MPAILMLTASVFVAGEGSAAGDSIINDSVIDFDHEIIPVLTKAGCNSGSCHGAAVGRGGFRLSLYGGDPEFDYQSIALELEGRRVNPARPRESLLILNPPSRSIMAAATVSNTTVPVCSGS